MEIDYYKYLGILPTADEKMIRKAYRLKSKEVHPDVNRSKDAKHKFNRLTEAQETLLNPAARLKHDRFWGYYEKPKNQETNTKQEFSDFQKAKAKQNVDEWSRDYGVAMGMREKQRRQAISKHKRNFLFFLLGMFVVVAFIFLWLFFAS